MVGVGGSSPLSPTSPLPGWWYYHSEKNFPKIPSKLPSFPGIGKELGVEGRFTHFEVPGELMKKRGIKGF